MALRDSEVVRDAGNHAFQERPAFDDNGVDLTLIREYLRLTPLERLRSLQNVVRTIGKFRRVAQKTSG